MRYLAGWDEALALSVMGWREVEERWMMARPGGRAEGAW